MVAAKKMLEESIELFFRFFYSLQHARKLLVTSDSSDVDKLNIQSRFHLFMSGLLSS